VAAVDHDARCLAGFFEEAAGLVHRGGVIIDGLASAAEDDVAIGIAGGERIADWPYFRVAEKVCG